MPERQCCLSHAVVLLGCLLALGASSGCREAVSAVGTTPDDTRLRAEEMLRSLDTQFGAVSIEPSYAKRRPRLVHGVPVPSRAFKDPSLWTEVGPGPSRSLTFRGFLDGRTFRLGIEASPPPPVQSGDYRSVLRLRQLGANEYQWTMRAESALGNVTIEGLNRALEVLLGAAESPIEVDARPRVRQSLPRTARALGRAWSLEALHLTPVSDGSTRVSIAIALSPLNLQTSFPRYARFLQETVTPMLLRFQLADESGRVWLDAWAAHGRFGARLRVCRSSLVPIDGERQPVPLQLRATGDISVKRGIFRIGFRGLQAAVTLRREPYEAGFSAGFQQSPGWELPPLVGTLLHGPLSRPFEGDGSRYAFTVRESAGSPTVAVRELSVAVRENWLLRWLGSMADQTVSEYEQEVEAESDRFMAEVLEAYRSDVRAAIAPD